MKCVAALCCIFGLLQNASAQQEMAYRFGYIFQKKRLEDKGKLSIINKGTAQKIETVGYIRNDSVSGDTVYVFKSVQEEQQLLSERTIHTRLKGTVTKRSKDSLFIKFWDISTERATLKLSNKDVSSNDNQKDFVYVINKASWKHERSFDLPFRFTQLMATSLPFRVLTNSGKLESDFLNANIALLFVRGKTKLFKSEFVKARNRYFAVGPYVGLSSIDNEIKSSKEFGLNYGVNLVGALQGLNVTVAYGFQNGFHSDTKKLQPYIGFGIGFKLVETFAPEIKSKDDE